MDREAFRENHLATANKEFQEIYAKYRPFMDRQTQEVCDTAVIGIDRDSWYVQSGFSLIDDPAGFGDTAAEASEAFFALLLSDKLKRPL